MDPLGKETRDSKPSFCRQDPLKAQGNSSWKGPGECETCRVGEQLRPVPGTTEYVLLALALVLGVVCIALVCVWSDHFRGGISSDARPAAKHMNWHMMLAVCGFIVCNAEAVVLLHTLPSIKYICVYSLHALLQTAAIVLMAIAVANVVRFTNDIGSKHFQSLHTWLGIGTFVIYGLQFIASWAVFLHPGDRKKATRRFSLWHTFIGIYMLVLSGAAALTGMGMEQEYVSGAVEADPVASKDWHAERNVGNALSLCLMALVGTTVLTVLHSHVRKTKLAVQEALCQQLHQQGRTNGLGAAVADVMGPAASRGGSNVNDVKAEGVQIVKDGVD